MQNPSIRICLLIYLCTLSAAVVLASATTLDVKANKTGCPYEIVTIRRTEFDRVVEMKKAKI